MQKRVCFVELGRNEHGLYEGVQSTETACLRAWLKRQGVDTSAYVEDAPVSVNDMAEDILALSDEILVFVVHEEEAEINQALIQAILDCEEVEIYALGSGRRLLIDGIYTLGERPEEELLEKIGLEKKQDIRLEEASPYLDKILLPREIFRYGLWTGRGQGADRLETLGKELDYLKGIYEGIDSAQEKLLKLTGRNLQSTKELSRLLAELEKVQIPYIRYQLPVSQELLKKMVTVEEKSAGKQLSAEEGVATEELSDGLVLQLFLQEDLQEENRASFRRLAEAARIGEIVCDAGLLEKGHILAQELRRILTLPQFQGKLPIRLRLRGQMEAARAEEALLPFALEKTKQAYYTYFRGHMKERMGLYAGVRTDGYVHHMEAEGQKLPVEAGFFNEMMSVNSSVYMEELPEDTATDRLIFDRYGVAHGSSENYETYRREADESLRNPSNLLRIREGRLRVNDWAFTSDSKVNKISYRQAKERISLLKEEADRHQEAVNLFRLETEEDYRLFLADADHFLESHQIVDLPLAYGCLQNACRFIGSGYCSAEKIPRLLAGQQGDLHLCDTGVDSGLKAASLFELTQDCFAGREKRLNERGCYSCPAQGMCSKCSELPPFMQADFCQVIKKRSYVLDYVFLPHYLTGLKESIRGFRQMKTDEVRISNEHMFNLTEDHKGSVAPYFPKFTSCVLWKDKYVLWSPSTNKYYSVNEAFAFYIELLLRRVKVSEAPELLAEHCGAEVQEAIGFITNMNAVLKKAGVLYREISAS